jgi:ABC-type antimicrobial peptide transport system permease subunit
MEIVGVVRAVENLTPQDPALPTVYYPLEQSYASRMSLVVRTAGAGRDYVDQVRREAQGVNRTVPVFRVLTLASHLAEAVADTRLAAVLVAVCGALALLLATIGVYGVLAYAVIRRTREIGVRIALGARSGDVVRLVLGEGFAVATVGIGLGLGAAALAVRALAAATTLYGISQADPLTFVAVPASMAGVALLAAVIPMRRALRIDPNMVLRQE